MRKWIVYGVDDFSAEKRPNTFAAPVKLEPLISFDKCCCVLGYFPSDENASSRGNCVHFRFKDYDFIFGDRLFPILAFKDKACFVRRPGMSNNEKIKFMAGAFDCHSLVGLYCKLPIL